MYGELTFQSACRALNYISYLPYMFTVFFTYFIDGFGYANLKSNAVKFFERVCMTSSTSAVKTAIPGSKW